MATASKRRRVKSSETCAQNSGYVDNWQAEKTVTECNLHMLTTEDCSDVIFRVGSKKQVVRAHRYVLISRSSVFYAMFCGPLAEKGEVTIPDIEPDVFREFLRYVYSEVANITLKNVLGMLYLSRKYAMGGLTEECLYILDSSLSEENVCKVLEASHIFHEAEAEKKALNILTTSGHRLVTSKSFNGLCHECFAKYLQSDDLRLSEEQIFEATMSWAKGKCKKRHIEATPENIRDVLGDLKYEIRFTSMSHEFLLKTVRESGLLTNDERISILDKTVCPDIDITPIKSAKRHGRNYQRVLRYRQSAFGLRCKDPAEEIAFSVSKDIELLGIYLYGSKNIREYHEVTVDVQDEDDVFLPDADLDGKYRLKLMEGKEFDEVFFSKPIPIKKEQVYTLTSHVEGHATFYGFEGKNVCEGSDGVQFIFADVCVRFKGGQMRGQMPGLLYRS